MPPVSWGTRSSAPRTGASVKFLWQWQGPRHLVHLSWAAYSECLCARECAACSVRGGAISSACCYDGRAVLSINIHRYIHILVNIPWYIPWYMHLEFCCVLFCKSRGCIYIYIYISPGISPGENMAYSMGHSYVRYTHHTPIQLHRQIHIHTYPKCTDF